MLMYSITKYNTVYIHYVPWFIFETNLCLLSMNQEMCRGGCVTQASVTENECM